MDRRGHPQSSPYRPHVFPGEMGAAQPRAGGAPAAGHRGLPCGESPLRAADRHGRPEAEGWVRLHAGPQRDLPVSGPSVDGRPVRGRGRAPRRSGKPSSMAIRPSPTSRPSSTGIPTITGMAGNSTWPSASSGRCTSTPSRGTTPSRRSPTTTDRGRRSRPWPCGTASWSRAWPRSTAPSPSWISTCCWPSTPT